MKKHILLAILSGVLLSISWPTYGVSLFIFVAFVPLLFSEYLIKQQHKKTLLKVFFLSYISFLIWNISTTWWLVYASIFGALFAILVNSFLMSLIFLSYHYIAKKNQQKYALIFIICFWIIFEKIHLNWDFSWPWLNLGNVFSENIHWIQWYEYTGSFGGTLWIWIVNILFFLAVIQYRNTKRISLLGFYALLCIALPIVISLFIFKNYKESGSETQIIVLQPNIDPYREKYQLTNTQVAQLLIDLTQKQITNKVSFVLAPETVFAQNIQYSDIYHDPALAMVESYLNENYPNTSFIGGVSMIQWILDKKDITEESNFFKENIWFNDYNSAIVLQAKHPMNLYHKSKLVVGVENFPYKSILPASLNSLMIDLGGTVASKTTQKQRSVFSGKPKHIKAAPIICYESVYGEFVSEYIRNGANFLAIITNDSWWGNTQGHKQLLSYARLRAIENRRSIARSANCGISAFINQKGEITASLAYETQGSLKQSIFLNDKITFYSQFGDYIFRIALFIGIFITLYCVLKKREVIHF